MPKNTAAGVFIGAFSFLFGFGIIWYMFWLAGLAALGILAAIFHQLAQKQTEYHLTAEEVQKLESQRPHV